MCGIAGFNWADKELVKKMTNVILHRGPDHGDFYIDKNISLGYRRLSIIDLSKKGRQPMYNEKKDIVAVFNGEIYNFKELREKLEKAGHRFYSDSDTEVIVHGYEEYKEGICKMLKGMFAFALWDINNKKLLIARDHIGEKPLYYFYDGGKLIFASEIKAILVHDIKREIDFQNLSDYLSLRFSPESKTMLRRIKKLQPGHYLTLKNQIISVKKYWELPRFTSNYTANKEILNDIIDSTIKEKMIADVPIGVFLSGGLDSSSVVAYLSKHKEDIKTFSIGFNDSSDETKYAELVSRIFNTEHHEIMTNKEESISFLPEAVWHLDEPMADPAALPTYILSMHVSKKVKVALSGEGGDEVFGGYESPNLLKKLHLVNKIPGLLQNPVGSYLVKGASYFFRYPKRQILQLSSEILAVNGLSEKYKKLFYLPFDSEDKKSLLSNRINRGLKFSTKFDEYLSNKNKLYSGTYLYYFKEWLPNDLLMKTDKMGMAHSLEIRAPFLDKNLIEYSCGLDWKYKERRDLFRKTVEKILPKEILRRKKQGFTLPLSQWFRRREFVSRTQEHLKDLRKRRLFNEKAYDSIIKNPNKFKNDHRLWVLLNLELWCKIYLDEINHKKINF